MTRSRDGVVQVDMGLGLKPHAGMIGVIVLGLTYWTLWRGRLMGRRFILGYAAAMPLIVLM